MMVMLKFKELFNEANMFLVCKQAPDPDMDVDADFNSKLDFV